MISDDLTGMKEELEWLRYFYGEVDSALGPVSEDVYWAIKEVYVSGGGTLPEGYDE